MKFERSSNFMDPVCGGSIKNDGHTAESKMLDPSSFSK